MLNSILQSEMVKIKEEFVWQSKYQKCDYNFFVHNIYNQMNNQ